MDKQIVTIQDENGNKTEVDLVSILLSEKEEKTYIVYSDGREDQNGMVDLLIAILNDENGELSINAIPTEEEFMYAQSLLQKQVGDLNG